MKNKVIIGLGSNIQPQKNIALALKSLENIFGSFQKSDFIQTEPIGYKQQDDFINGSIFIETDLSQEDLIVKLKSLEKKLGRTSSEIKYGPRTIDLDVIVFNNKIVDKDFYERDFLRTAAFQLKPDLQKNLLS